MVSKEIIKGFAYQGKKTKHLVGSLPKKSIAVIFHQDIDAVAAEMLIACRVKAVINVKTSMSGLFIHEGVEKLIKAGISVFDLKNGKENVNLDKQMILIKNEELFREVNGTWEPYYQLKKYSLLEVERLKQSAKETFPKQFKDFVENSLFFGKKELNPFVKEIKKLPILRHFLNKDVLIVARGANYEKDLKTIISLLSKSKLIIIGVDGGADGLLKNGIKPDYIIGDMDSVSEKALKCGANLLVHTYRNGRAPGEGRIKGLKIPYKRIVFLGTSEDVAIVFAYCSGAKRIYTIGTRIGMNEFLEKGRVGMGSSLLTRMKVGHALVDLKGVHSLFETDNRKSRNGLMLLPAAVVLLLISFSQRFDIFFSLILQWWSGR